MLSGEWQLGLIAWSRSQLLIIVVSLIRMLRLLDGCSCEEFLFGGFDCPSPAVWRPELSITGPALIAEVFTRVALWSMGSAVRAQSLSLNVPCATSIWYSGVVVNELDASLATLFA